MMVMEDLENLRGAAVVRDEYSSSSGHIVVDYSDAYFMYITNMNLDV